MTNNSSSIPSDQILISIEVGADYQVSEVLASLLEQVRAEVSDDEVSGFAMPDTNQFASTAGGNPTVLRFGTPDFSSTAGGNPTVLRFGTPDFSSTAGGNPTVLRFGSQGFHSTGSGSPTV